MKEQQTDSIIELAKRFIDEMQNLEPAFERAFFRFHGELRMYSSCASYTTPFDVCLVSAFREEEFYDEMDRLSLRVLSEMEHDSILMLLEIDKNFDYDIKFEYKDMERWQISLSDGGTGVPAD